MAQQVEFFRAMHGKAEGDFCDEVGQHGDLPLMEEESCRLSTCGLVGATYVSAVSRIQAVWFNMRSCSMGVDDERTKLQCSG
jgi:hypothetical protein